MTVQKETKTRYELNARQYAFANEYIKTGNAYQSALSAGYSPTYSKTNSHKMLAHKGIRAYIEERNKRVNKKILDEQVDIHEAANKLIKEMYEIDLFNQFIEEITIEKDLPDGSKMKTRKRNIPANPSDYLRAMELKAKIDGLLDKDDSDDEAYEIVEIENDIE